MKLRAVLAQNLRTLRNQRGISQEALADLAKIDRTYVSALEREMYAVSIDVIERLAIALNVAPAELIREGAADHR